MTSRTAHLKHACLPSEALKCRSSMAGSIVILCPVPLPVQYHVGDDSSLVLVSFSAFFSFLFLSRRLHSAAPPVMVKDWFQGIRRILPAWTEE